MPLDASKDFAAQIEQLSKQFNESATALQAAAKALRDEQEKNRQLQQQLDALKKAANAPAAGKHAEKAPATIAKNSLFDAVFRNDTALAKSLIEHGADINEKTYAGETPLVCAIIKGNEEIVSLLLKKGAYLNVISKAGKTALDYATDYWQSSHSSTAATIFGLVHRQKPKSPLQRGEMAMAAFEGDIAKIKSMIDQGADINDTTYGGETALIMAATFGNKELVELLLKYGADITLKERNYGHTALDVAEQSARSGQPQSHRFMEVVELLKKAAANQQLKPGESELVMAAYRGNVAKMKKLIGAGANINAVTPYGGDTALMEAASAGQLEAVRLLLENGADINIKNRYGYGVEISASAWKDDKHKEILKLVKEAFAKQQPKKDSNNTASKKHIEGSVSIAAHKGDIEAVRKQLEAGVDPDAQSDGTLTLAPGFTPLMSMACKGNVEMVKLLLQYGADPLKTSETYGQETAFDYALRDHPENKELLELLKKAMVERLEAKIKAAPAHKAARPTL